MAKHSQHCDFWCRSKFDWILFWRQIDLATPESRDIVLSVNMYVNPACASAIASTPASSATPYCLAVRWRQSRLFVEHMCRAGCISSHSLARPLATPLMVDLFGDLSGYIAERFYQLLTHQQSTVFTIHLLWEIIFLSFNSNLQVFVVFRHWVRDIDFCFFVAENSKYNTYVGLIFRNVKTLFQNSSNLEIKCCQL